LPKVEPGRSLSGIALIHILIVLVLVLASSPPRGLVLPVGKK
jgi:hypothetical protein